MLLQNISNGELIERMQKLVRTERKVMHLVLIHIAEIEVRKLCADLGFDGMYSYLTKGLGYSESAAYRRLQSARLLKQIPAVTEKIEAGSLNLSQLTQVQKCLKEKLEKGETVSPEETMKILTTLENKNAFETQKILALEMNLPVEVHQKVKPQQDESVRIELTLSKEQFAELELAKSLLSHICPNGNLSEVIATLAKKFNQGKLAGKSSTHTAAATKVITTEGVKANRRQYISIHTKRALLSKAQHCCEYCDPNTQKRCSSKYKLEVDHRHPVALGGANDFQNLRILCQTHNALAARQAGLGSSQLSG